LQWKGVLWERVFTRAFTRATPFHLYYDAKTSPEVTWVEEEIDQTSLLILIAKGKLTPAQCRDGLESGAEKECVLTVAGERMVVQVRPPVIILRLRNMTAIDATGLQMLEHSADLVHDAQRCCFAGHSTNLPN
jgi:hypothetical protein